MDVTVTRFADVGEKSLASTFSPGAKGLLSIELGQEALVTWFNCVLPTALHIVCEIENMLYLSVKDLMGYKIPRPSNYVP